ncbi:MAG: hypothetical protein M1814_000567 [Vezdaea aestivalis]|nr:MAG: hypothetical protein M1814_000567 [Vezdaea aestivalis]
MASTTKKPPASQGSNRRTSINPPESPASLQRRQSRSPGPTNIPPTNGVARARSVRGSGNPVSARAAVKRPGASPSTLSTKTASDLEDEDARAERESLMDDLKSRLEKAELASESYEKQLQILHGQLEGALKDHSAAEELVNEQKEAQESLEAQVRDAQRREREMELIYEAEQSSMTKEKEGMVVREEELHMIIQRLKESLAQREPRNLDDIPNNSSPSFENQFAPPSTLQRSNSQNNSKIVHQKDKIIESLRLELAEAQIKLVESDHLGGGRTQELERLLLEQRVANARLMEDNESFQLLLSQKTLNGDFSKIDIMTSAAGGYDDRSDSADNIGSSLADELDSAADDGEGDKSRRLEQELKSQKDANKALTVYINSIIERLLNHKDFESILDKTPGLMAGPGAASGRKSGSEKELPPPPPPEASGQSILQRAKSVAIGGGRARPRPQSFMPPPTSKTPLSSELPTGAPLARSQSVKGSSHRRANSEWTAGATVNQMYRPPSGPGQISPPVGPPARTSSFFAPPAPQGNPNAAARIPSGASAAAARRPGSSSNSTTTSEYSGEVSTPSPPTSVTSSTPAPSTGAPMAAMAGSKLRPLRLVQESQAEAEAEAKRAKRGSWMGWFNRGKDETPQMMGGEQGRITEEAERSG